MTAKGGIEGEWALLRLCALQQFAGIDEDLQHGLSFDVAWRNREQVAGGGERVDGVDRAARVVGQVVILANAGAGADPGDAAAAGVFLVGIAAVPATGATVVGGDDDN